jgi:transglutaminase-like putative cysteine protease
MNQLNRSALFIFLCMFSLAGTAQYGKQDIKMELTKKYADEPCIAIKEEVKFNFNLVKTGKKEDFVISENFYSSQFTPNNSYSKSNVIFYDDYSSVKNLVCKKNGTSLGLLPVVYSNFEKAEVFHDDVKLCAYKVDMVKNQNTEFLYTKEYGNPRFFSKIYFHESYPIEEKTLVFEIPEWVSLDIREFNFEGYKIEKTEKAIPAKKAKEIRYVLKSLKPIPDERHKPNIAKTHPHLMVTVKSYKGKLKSESYFSTHNDVYAWCKNLADSVDNNPEVFADKLKEIKGNEKDSVLVMEKVFYWIQDHVRYIAFEDGIMGYKPQAASKVYNMLYGDCKGMANLTKTMLRSLGYDARLTWIGTKDIPYSNDLPSLGVYNHMICTVFLGGKKYFLDGTENFIALNDYAERIQGRPVMIENGKTYLKDVIPSFETERNKVEIKSKMDINGKLLKGQSTITLNGEEKTNFLRNVNDIKTENQVKAISSYLKSGNPDVSIVKYSNSNFNERRNPFTINSEYEISNKVFYSKDKKEIVLLPEKDGEFENFIFDTTRVSDYEFYNRYFLTSVCDITIPGGYAVKSLPQSVNISNDTYDFSLSYAQVGNAIRQSKKIVIKKTLIRQSNFKTWNEDISKLKKFYNEPLTLKQ